MLVPYWLRDSGWLNFVVSHFAFSSFGTSSYAPPQNYIGSVARNSESVGAIAVFGRNGQLLTWRCFFLKKLRSWFFFFHPENQRFQPTQPFNFTCLSGCSHREVSYQRRWCRVSCSGSGCTFSVVVREGRGSIWSMWKRLVERVSRALGSASKHRSCWLSPRQRVPISYNCRALEV